MRVKIGGGGVKIAIKLNFSMRTTQKPYAFVYSVINELFCVT